jgi:putative heme-binding domain-containing protein
VPALQAQAAAGTRQAVELIDDAAAAAERREQIIRSILRPSDEFAPQWQAWFVETKDGEVHQGLQLDHKAAGAIELFTTAGRTEHFKGGEIARYGVRQNSLMPDGLEAGLTVEDFRNLVAFLESTQ